MTDRHSSSPITGPSTPAPGLVMGRPVVFIVPDPHTEVGTSLVMIPPPFRVFCGQLMDVDRIERHGIWVSQRPDVGMHATVDRERDFLLADFGMRFIAPEYKQAQTQFEVLLLVAIADQLGRGQPVINVQLLIQQALKPGSPLPVPPPSR